MLTDTLAIIIIVGLICIVILYYALMGTINVKDHTNSINSIVETKQLVSKHNNTYTMNLLLIGIPNKYIVNEENVSIILNTEIKNNNIYNYVFKASCKGYHAVDLNFTTFIEYYKPLYKLNIINYDNYQKFNNKRIIALYLYSYNDAHNNVIIEFLNSLATTIVTNLIEGESTPSI